MSLDHLAIRARKAWAYRQICEVFDPPPTYGSTDWCALADTDPRKLASAIVAAEAEMCERDLEHGVRLIPPPKVVRA